MSMGDLHDGQVARPPAALSRARSVTGIEPVLPQEEHFNRMRSIRDNDAFGRGGDRPGQRNAARVALRGLLGQALEHGLREPDGQRLAPGGQWRPALATCAEQGPSSWSRPRTAGGRKAAHRP